MPSTSAKQRRTMAAIAHGWKPDKEGVRDIPVSVAKEFNEADQRKAKRERLVRAMTRRR